PAKSITTIVANTVNKAPTLEVAYNDTVLISDHGMAEVSVTNITNGGDHVSNLTDVTARFSDPSLISGSSVERFEANDSAVVRFTPDPLLYGETDLVVEARETTPAENGAFNAVSSRTIHVKVIPYVNQPPGIDPVGAMTLAPFSDLQHIKLTGITDGNTNDGREVIKFSLSSRQGLCVSRQVKYEQGSDTAQMIFATKSAGHDTLDLIISDNFGTELGGNNLTHIVIPVNIEETAGVISGAAHVEVYPNPAGDIIHIAAAGDRVTDVALYDLSGRKVFEGKNVPGVHSTEIIVPVTNIQNGMYVLKLYTANSGYLLRKIMIRR
ncbi:MAG TPA: T9SS type A sorting domain-containing protein, partial [Bacteroidales bacterium]|nr:T9SS type A sorting domain-containing protein [Bacteroidales bacterium]